MARAKRGSIAMWPEVVTAEPAIGSRRRAWSLLGMCNGVNETIFLAERTGDLLPYDPSRFDDAAAAVRSSLRDRCLASLEAGGSRRAFWREGPFERLCGRKE